METIENLIRQSREASEAEDWATVISVQEEIIEREPTRTAYLILAKACEKIGDIQRAIAVRITIALQFQPDSMNETTLKRLKRQAAQQADGGESNDNLNLPVPSYKEVTDNVLRACGADALFYYTDQAVQAKDFEAELRFRIEFNKRAPQNPIILANVITVLIKLDRFDEAQTQMSVLEDMISSFDIQPGQLLLMRIRDMKRTLGIEIEPPQTQLQPIPLDSIDLTRLEQYSDKYLFEYANAAMKKGDFDIAIACRAAKRKRSPDDYVNKLCLAQALEASGKSENLREALSIRQDLLRYLHGPKKNHDAAGHRKAVERLCAKLGNP